MIPIISYFMMGGRCRNCTSPVSIQYPLVEIGTGILFGMAGIFFFAPALLGSLVFWIALLLILAILALLVFITVYDLHHQIIPDRAAYLFAILSAPFLFIDLGTYSLSLPSITHLLAAPIISLPFVMLWYFSGGKWMGLGDGKLVWGFGWVLGLSGGLTAIVLGFWIGAAWAVAILLWQAFEKKTGGLPSKGLSMKSEIPFAPFLILGFLLVLFSSWTLLDLILFTI
jgi:prepilin signal peptidase PulO-like enzyme (type II secretory pathway)